MFMKSCAQTRFFYFSKPYIEQGIRTVTFVFIINVIVNTFL